MNIRRNIKMDTIFVYTKKQAVEDGFQVDISNFKETKEIGFKTPVYLTRSVFEIVKVPEGLESCQDFSGRLWDLLWMATLKFKALLRQNKDAHLIPFKAIFQTGRNERKTIEFWMIFNKFEGFTIMKPEEY